MNRIFALALIVCVGLECGCGNSAKQTNPQPVQSIPTTITVTPHQATVVWNQTVTYTAVVTDQFGAVMTNVNGMTWAMSPASGSGSNSCADFVTSPASGLTAIYEGIPWVQDFPSCSFELGVYIPQADYTFPNNVNPQAGMFLTVDAPNQ